MNMHNSTSQQSSSLIQNQSGCHSPKNNQSQLFFFSKAKVPIKLTTFNDYFNDKQELRINKYLASKTNTETGQINRSKTESSLGEDLSTKLRIVTHRLIKNNDLEENKLLKSTSQHVGSSNLTPKMRQLQTVYQPKYNRKKSSKTIMNFRPLSQITKQRQNNSNSNLQAIILGQINQEPDQDYYSYQLQLIKQKVQVMLEKWKQKEQKYKANQSILQQEINRLNQLLQNYENNFVKQK